MPDKVAAALIERCHVRASVPCGGGGGGRVSKSIMSLTRLVALSQELASGQEVRGVSPLAMLTCVATRPSQAVSLMAASAAVSARCT